MAASQLTHVSFCGAVPARRGGAGEAGAKSACAARAVARLREPLDPLLISTLREAGLNPSAYRSTVLARRLAACERAVGTRADVAGVFNRRPGLAWAALDAVLIGVTEFFRDPAVFAALETEVLPELLRSRRGLRIYSAGVSSGQELYSVAMLLAEGGGLARCELVGVDCRPRAILTARLGIYGEPAVAGLSPARQLRFFQPVASGWRVDEELARAVRFHAANVLTYRERESWDLILFRNVAIYLDAVAAGQAWESLVAQLTPGGYLCSGPAEKPPAHLPLRRVRRCLWRKELS
jgi:chemotaxis methyl-accepting protein methylase